MSDRTCRVRLDGGPRDGWVYDVALHWEVMSGRLEWVAPSVIVLTGWPGRDPIGNYHFTGITAEGIRTYGWHPLERAVASMSKVVGE